MNPIDLGSQSFQVAPLKESVTPKEERIHDGSSGFGEVLEGVIASANAKAKYAAGAAEAFAAGSRDDIHGTMLALSKADIELRLVGAMRNKVIDAFNEIWRMQI